MKELPDGSKTQILEENDPERINYIETYNRQDMVMNRLNNFDAYIKELTQLRNRKTANQLENFAHIKGSNLKQIPQN